MKPAAPSTLRPAWRRFQDRLPRTLRPTRAGKFLLVIAIGMGMAALNTGNNLLFLAWGLVLGSIIVSGLLSESTLRIVGIAPQRQEPAFAGVPTTLSLEVTNNSTRVPAYALTLSLRYVHQTVRAAAEGYVLRAAPGAATRARVTTTFPGRGVWSLSRSYVRTQFPFGFFEKSRWFAHPGRGDVLVYPARIPVRLSSSAFRPTAGQQPTTTRGQGDEYFSLRPFQTGDDRRHVHWKKSAQRGRLMVQEYARDTDDDLYLVLAPGPEHNGDSNERAVSVVAAVCTQLLDEGRAVGLLIPGRHLAPGRGAAQETNILTALALCDLAASLPLAQVPRGAPGVCVVADGGRGPSGFTAQPVKALL